MLPSHLQLSLVEKCTSQAPWVYLLETDYLILKPVAAPGLADSDARSLGFFYNYVFADAPKIRVRPSCCGWFLGR